LAAQKKLNKVKEQAKKKLKQPIVDVISINDTEDEEEPPKSNTIKGTSTTNLNYTVFGTSQSTSVVDPLPKLKVDD